MNRIQILCINKEDRDDPTERIRFIGGKNGDGSRWIISVTSAIEKIEKREWEFFVKVNFKETKVVVAKSRFENKYIKTEADDYAPNNLLNLPECP